MRYIDKSKVECPEGWLERATEALNDVTKNDAKVDSHGSVWRECKEALSRASDKKCWYCESMQERSDNSVDHFRPKDHYWWLAYDAENFRYACTYCNSKRRNPTTGRTGGKGNSFPLQDEAKRAKNRGEEQGESPMLLDPCQPMDPGLLDFRDDGHSRPRYGSGMRHERATVSIDLYNLNHRDIVERRQVLATKIIEKINDAERIYARVDTGDVEIDHSFNSIIKDLARALSDAAELSSFSRCVIAGHRDKEWVEPLLATA